MVLLISVSTEAHTVPLPHGILHLLGRQARCHKTANANPYGTRDPPSSPARVPFHSRVLGPQASDLGLASQLLFPLLSFELTGVVPCHWTYAIL